ncbi:hypothetical protein JCM10213_000066 [Rhodosporidiobolus nylandii]
MASGPPLSSFLELLQFVQPVPSDSPNALPPSTEGYILPSHLASTPAPFPTLPPTDVKALMELTGAAIASSTATAGAAEGDPEAARRERNRKKKERKMRSKEKKAAEGAQELESASGEEAREAEGGGSAAAGEERSASDVGEAPSVPSPRPSAPPSQPPPTTYGLPSMFPPVAVTAWLVHYQQMWATCDSMRKALWEVSAPQTGRAPALGNVILHKTEARPKDPKSGYSVNRTDGRVEFHFEM